MVSCRFGGSERQAFFSVAIFEAKKPNIHLSLTFRSHSTSLFQPHSSKSLLSTGCPDVISAET